MNDQALPTYFEFDQADLEANRNGILSEKEKQKLGRQRKYDQQYGLKVGYLLLAVALILLLIYIIFFMAFGGGGIGLGFVLLVCAAIGYLELHHAYTAKIDTSKDLIKRVEGPIRITGEQGRHAMAYTLYIGKKEFEVDEELTGYVNQGDIYAIYFDGSKILSTEWLSKGK